MTAGPAIQPAAVVPSVAPARPDALEVHGKFPPVKAWELVCASLTFGALCFFTLYFAWYFWTGTLLI